MRPRLLLAMLVAAAVLAAPAPGAADPPRHVVPCSRGLVALTFDDGPLDTVTPRLVRLLRRLEVPATFFMVGNRAADHPELVRLVDRAGFAIGNHTWEHADLTTQTGGEIWRALHRTRHALRQAGVTPTDFARPPYGAVDDRVQRVLGSEGYVPVLWTIDSRDWTGLSPKQIVRGVVSAVRPHRTNVVLQHDGVANSPATVKALPDEVATLRRRGYCFAALGADGDPTPPVPEVLVRADRTRVAEGGSVGLTVRLDRPTSRPTAVRVRLQDVDSGPDDYGWSSRTVRFPVGDTSPRHLTLPIARDGIDEDTEEVMVRTDVPHVAIRIIDRDPPPAVRLAGSTVTAAPILDTEVRVTVHLDRRSGRAVSVLLRGPGGPLRVLVPPGRTAASATVTIPPGAAGRLGIAGAEHARPAGNGALVVRAPEQTWLEAARTAVSAISWPAIRPARVF